MKKYEKYKDSGIEWIGEIPEHWELRKFAHISYMKGRIGWQGLKQSEFTQNEEEPFLITGMNFKDGVINWDDVYHISEERYSQAPEIQLYDNDVLITKDGTIGKLLYVNTIPYPHKASLNSHLLVLRPLQDAYVPRFLYYQLQSLPFKHHVELTKTGTTFFGISQDAMGKYKAILPSSKEQTAIATYLDRKTAQIDQLTADKQRLLELYDEEKIALINQAVTKGVNPDVPMKDSGIEWLGDIPELWEVKRLKYVANSYPSNVDKKSKEGEKEVLLCNYVDVYKNDFITSEIQFMKATASDSQIEKFKLKKGDVIATKDSESPDDIAIPALVREDFENVICGYHLNFIRPIDILGDFLFRFFQSEYTKGYFFNAANGVTRYGIGTEKFSNFVVCVPPIEEQKAIINHIETECALIDAKTEKTKKLIELQKEYKTALISEVVTGKVKVI